MKSEQRFTVQMNDTQRALLAEAARFLGTEHTTCTNEQRRQLIALWEMLRDLPDEERDDPGATHMLSI